MEFGSKPSFGDRHGITRPVPALKVRHEAPIEFRHAVVMAATAQGYAYSTVRETICGILLTAPSGAWSEIPNIRDEVIESIENCFWADVYEIAEALYARFANNDYDLDRAHSYQAKINKALTMHGIGWQMSEGQFEVRGEQAFEAAMAGAEAQLEEVGYPAAARALRLARQALSVRPEPNLNGAIVHAFQATECVARSVSGHDKSTLGTILAGKELRAQMPAELRSAGDMLWKFASDKARHINEGREVDFRDAEMAVTIAAALCSYIAACQ